MRYCVVYLASPYESTCLSGNTRYDMLCESIKNTSKIFSDIDYVVFHEDFNETHESNIINIHKNTTFEKLDFLRNDLDFVKFGRPKGYMLMCRFFSGELQNNLIKRGYDAYIRFDDDSFLIEPYINKVEFEKNINDNDYIFRTLFNDKQSKYNNGLQMQSLFEFTRDFLIDKGYDVKKQYTHLKNINFLDNNLLYTGLAPYNNFHACKLSLWEDKLIKDYVDKIMEVNGCLMNYWMDANIHAMIIYVIIPFTDKNTYLKTNFGYRHNRHFSILNSAGGVYKNNESFYPKS